jgi:hypothetical protein
MFSLPVQKKKKGLTTHLILAWNFVYFTRHKISFFLKRRCEHVGCRNMRAIWIRDLKCPRSFFRFKISINKAVSGRDGPYDVARKKFLRPS